MLCAVYWTDIGLNMVDLLASLDFAVDLPRILHPSPAMPYPAPLPHAVQ